MAMRRLYCRLLQPIALWCLLGAGAAQAASGPSLACTRPSGQVERQICADPALVARDRRLAQVYQAALAQARGALARRLMADQRGWVKGRNDCWKADGQATWITASWTVDTVAACIDAQYRLRTSELQAVWRLEPPVTTRYICQNRPANEVVVNLFATDPPTLRLERGDRTATLWRVGDEAGGHYEGQNVDGVLQAGALRLSWLDVGTGQTEVIDCRAQ